MWRPSRNSSTTGPEPRGQDEHDQDAPAEGKGASNPPGHPGGAGRPGGAGVPLSRRRRPAQAGGGIPRHLHHHPRARAGPHRRLTPGGGGVKSVKAGSRSAAWCPTPLLPLPEPLTMDGNESPAVPASQDRDDPRPPAGRAAQPGHPPAWAPLGQPLFRAVWAASFVSNVGTWVHNVAAAWLMTSLAPSPLLVALVQTATSLPFFLLAMPAGALADVLDRRRLLMVTQTWMLLAAAALGALTLAGLASPWVLLAFTFLLGLGAALTRPAWMAAIPELVPPRDMPAAVVLNSVGFNLALAVGPALGGLVVNAAGEAAVGAGAAFLLNAVSFLGVLAVLYRW